MLPYIQSRTAIDDVRIDLHRRQDGQWNLTRLLKMLGMGTSARPQARAIVPQLDRHVAVTVTHGTFRLGEGVEFTDLGIGLQLAAGRLAVRQAEANIAGGVVALQGEVSLQEPTPGMALHWRLADIRLDRLLGPAFRPVMIAEATGRLTQEGDGFVLETAVHVPTFTLPPGTLGGRQPHLTHAASTCTLRLLSPFTHLVAEECRLDAAEARLSLRGSTAVDYDVHSDLIHRLLFGEVIDLAEKIPVLGTVLRDVNPFQLIHRHIELSATVRGDIFHQDAAGQPDVHVSVYVVQ